MTIDQPYHPDPVRSNAMINPWVPIVGGALAVVGSFLPWVTVLTVFGSISHNGVDGGHDGVATVILGLAAAGIGLSRITTRTNTTAQKVGSILLGLIIGVIAVVDIQDAQVRIANMTYSAYARVELGSGLYVVILGAAVVLASALTRTTPRPPRAVPAPAAPEDHD